MEVLYWILALTLINGLMAFTGAVTLLLSDKTLTRLLYFLVSFSAGALLGGAFIHLLPESTAELGIDNAVLTLLCGFSFFFLMEKFLHWHHCHERECTIHEYSYMLLFGDGVHNLIDGFVIAAAFLTDTRLGLITSFLIIAHEIPQELGNFGVLLHAGMDKYKALLYNFLAQLTCVLGGLLGYFLPLEGLTALLLPFAAGGFIYISASDLIPQLHKESDPQKSMTAFLTFLVGVAFMLAMKILTKGNGI
ncbi:MAG: ZIP family metal transporter [Candidatus Altiarchaeota archaeon]